MTIYANINSKNKIVGIDVSKIERDEYCSDDVQNVEVTQDIYDNANKYGINYYIYDNGDIVLNPDYQEEDTLYRALSRSLRSHRSQVHGQDVLYEQPHRHFLHLMYSEEVLLPSGYSQGYSRCPLSLYGVQQV